MLKQNKQRIHNKQISNLMTYNTTDALGFSINSAAKWHNLNNHGCKPTANYNLNVTALKGLNIRLVYSVHYSTPPGLTH